ncbi:helix-turn-helix domain-containing protein [Chryseobacterium wangxinyae]|uniref:helix-turn-helix domain-containing protein n=1 Tax=Chryseobacterium sp. CY353 TaxID=2997334 RepID=UPI00226FE625|nr:helix-turn-helix domain-containing protein [Chryseobacterium sp. CY353]MCY0970848.1 helix-turn-helix domain-containing protein [Chryseobacterium sp. CY353]
MNKILFFFSLLLLTGIQAQKQAYSYAQISHLLSSYSENDERAMVFVNLYIKKAKKEQKASKLIAGYDEAVYYSSSVHQKLRYADSAVTVSLKSKKADLISWAYLKKGIIYYYNKRDYRLALQQYLIALSTAKETKDLYMRNKIVYHLGMVRSYLGYYEEASRHFMETAIYFERNISDKDHPNIRLNNESGYYNSIYRLSSCYKNLKQYRKEDSLIAIGIKRLKSADHHPLEFAYFQKGKGIQQIRKGDYKTGLKHLKLAENILMKEGDFASLATVDFYIGKVYWNSGDRQTSLVYLNRVDSIITEFKFVTPEITANYQYLIDDAKEKNNERQQLYYTNQLIRVDSIVKADFAFLSAGIYREYDINSLTEDRDRLLRKNKYGLVLIFVIIAGSLILLFYLINRHRKREHRLTLKYHQLLEKLNNHTISSPRESEIVVHQAKDLYSVEVIENIKKNLKVFVEKEKFRDIDLTLEQMAKLIGCKRNALSYFLNNHLHTTYHTYIKNLRIEYITRKLMEDKIYLKYSMETLAKEGGMKNRQVFSNHFLEIHGIRPADFVRKRAEELNQENV